MRFLRLIVVTSSACAAGTLPVCAQSPQMPAPEQVQQSAASPIEAGAQQLVRGNVEQAIAFYTDALKDTGLANDRRATVLNDRAVAYARIGQFKQALDDYNRAIGLFPEYAAAYNNRGNALLTLSQPAEAVKDFDRAVLLAPNYAAAYSNRATARIKLGEPAAALADFTKAIELMPSSAPPLSGRGLALLEIGKPHAAIRDFSRAVHADTRFASAYRNRAEARLLIGQRDEAVEDLSRAIAFDITNAELYVARGYAYLLSANMASAIKDFSRAIEIAPNSASAYQGRGLANGFAEAYDEAFSDLNRAIELDPRAAAVFAYRAYVYKQTNQPDVALKDVQTALKLNADCAEALWVRGEIEEASGAADTAVADLRRSLELKPEWKPASDALTRLGANIDVGQDKEAPGLGIGDWRVVVRNQAYYAVSDLYPALRVPLEMVGEGNPQLLGWELKENPYKGYAILRFSGGRVPGKNGPEETELAAIIDVQAGKIIGIQPHRQGARVAEWTWEGGRVQVASVDGVTDEFILRSERPTAAAWDDPYALPPSARHEPRPQRKVVKKKPKTIFQLLFGG